MRRTERNTKIGWRRMQSRANYSLIAETGKNTGDLRFSNGLSAGSMHKKAVMTAFLIDLS
jgi:hypothetical protein